MLTIETGSVLSQAFTLPSTPASVAAARQWARQILDHWQLSQLHDSSAVLVSELLTNAIQHADTGRTPIKLRLIYTSATLRIEVRDLDITDLPNRRMPLLDEETGRGLLIVDNYADRWSVQVSDAGKTVWCELDISPPDEADGPYSSKANSSKSQLPDQESS